MPKINYLAIRCYVSHQNPYTSTKRREYTDAYREEFRLQTKDELNFQLVEQVEVSQPSTSDNDTFKIKAWFVELRNDYRSIAQHIRKRVEDKGARFFNIRSLQSNEQQQQQQKQQIKSKDKG